MKTSLRQDFISLWYIISRCFAMFWKDGFTVFLSLLAPLIVLLLYLLFLGGIQTDNLMAYFPEGVISEDSASAFVDSWMIAGVLGTACVTVSFT